MTVAVALFVGTPALFGLFMFMRPAMDAIREGDSTLKRFTMGAKVVYAIAAIAFMAVAFAMMAVACN